MILLKESEWVPGSTVDTSGWSHCVIDFAGAPFAMGVAQDIEWPGLGLTYLGVIPMTLVYGTVTTATCLITDIRIKE